jgi:hypothetical protein
MTTNEKGCKVSIFSYGRWNAMALNIQPLIKVDPNIQPFNL